MANVKKHLWAMIYCKKTRRKANTYIFQSFITDNISYLEIVQRSWQ